jgi:2-alkyl-3-oxoalkanoate reductase
VTVLVTGGSGLVGSHVLEALRARGERAVALVRAESRAAVQALGAEPVIGDVADPASWARAVAQTGGQLRGIVHAAALVAPRAAFSEFERVNVGGTRLAIEAAQRASARLVHVSSAAVYGRSAVYDTADVTEDFEFGPLPDRDFYARTKRTADELVRAAGTDAIAIRPNVIYGERDRLFSPRVLATVRRGVIPQIGPGTNHLSCVYAGNVAAAIIAALDAPEIRGFRAYNVTRDAPPHLTQREFLAAFAAAAGSRARFIQVPIPLARVGVWLWNLWLRTLYPRRYGGLAGAAVSFITGENPFSAARISAELGWRPPFATADAIRRTVAHSVRRTSG